NPSRGPASPISSKASTNRLPGPASLLVPRVSLAVVPGDQLIRHQPHHDTIRFLQRPPEPGPSLLVAIPNGDPLQPRLPVLGPHLCGPASQHGPVRPVLRGDAHRDARSV